ncbi:hypothetical protein HCN44_004394 [Aphidius gifuensis]|uniref:Sulfotransferase domain-containing protein n=1 Tax=Aphidius gifuensis TaxID=684658 RepID=A0A835CT20_APHGI|nr:carbohydrate sulfotransferase 5-like [Aphidius gifuensis]KAF7994922.1 hypothetical protein HCN44_004394 [Aphidius gifuensis]
MSRRRVSSTKISKRLSFFGLVVVASICIFFLVFNQRTSNYIEHRFQSPVQIYRNNLTQMEIHEVIEMQKKILERELEDYNYPLDKTGLNVSSFDDLMMEKGGRPMRSIILATWRSGSTFLGDVLQAHPANFYHYEPLLDFGITQVRGSPMSHRAIKNINALFNCQYHKLESYLYFGRTHPWVFNHNTQLWRQCQSHKRICWNSDFVTKFCRLFPFQSMKLVRLRLKVAEFLLKQKKLGVRMVLLVRDPRGLLQSRKHRDWCPKSPDCSEPARVCADLVSDYEAAVNYKKKYPNNFMVVRYEDFSLDPYTNTENLYKFYGLDLHKKVKYFLDTHTSRDFGGVSSTFRNSKTAPFHWRNDLAFEEVEEIQSVCSNAMRLWGYQLALNHTHQKEFHPLMDYQLEL